SSDAVKGSDLLLLQEMDEEGVDAIARSLGHNYVYGAATVHSRTGKNFGNAVLSPWPLSDAGRVSLPRGSRLRGENRVVVRATARISESFVQAYSVHTETVTLPWKQRVQQFRRIAAHASSWMGDHVVVAGDFNTVARRGVGVLTELMEGIDLERVSAGAGPTFRRASLSWPLDHIFARGMSVIDTGVLEGAEGSDHFPLWARLRIS
ncbi:MAG: endonuclease/exonuclease/phosphatase family protein, partial [Thermoleophilia bacterium]|nr:endonuclease/exonuclease/phosphatase family protein [Thermoleophilia bacterium]